MVTHPTTNQAQRRASMLIETNLLPLSHYIRLLCLNAHQFFTCIIRLSYVQHYQQTDSSTNFCAWETDGQTGRLQCIMQPTRGQGWQ